MKLTATRVVGSVKLAASRNAPTMLTAAGVAGFIVTNALTIRATTRALEKLPEIKKSVAEVKSLEIGEDVTAKEKQRQMAIVYIAAVKTLAVDFGPPLIVGSLSIAALISGHGMMLKRQANLLAAYTALDMAFKRYRQTIREELGEEKELELYRRPVMRALDEHEGDTTQINGEDDVMPSPYARFFDESSPNWRKTPEYNLMFLRSQQDWANDILTARGHLFLNEVYDALGLERSQAGQIVGWKKNGNGDGFVDFGLYAIGDECNRAFVNIIEHTVLLDFNVDGPIRI
jgi:hypothetical protein